MDKSKAIEMLKQCLEEIPQLEELHYDNQKFELWRNKVSDILEAAFGRSSSEWDKFVRAAGASIYSGTEIEYQQEYNRRLYDYETALKSTIQKYEILGVKRERSYIEVPPESVLREVPPKAFIAHGGDSPALSKLKNFLEALGVEPIVVEEQPSEGRSVAENVDWYSRQADCAVILATKGDVDGKTGGFIPRGNVLMEIGKLQELLKDRIVYLVQAGTKLPTNISEKVRVRFSPQSMDGSFIKIAKELKKIGILKAVKPQE